MGECLLWAESRPDHGNRFSLVVAVQRVLLGPHASVRLGMSWTEIVAIYYVGLALGGCAYGALRPLSQYLPVAILSGVLLVLPVCLSLGVFLGLGLNKPTTLRLL